MRRMLCLLVLVFTLAGASIFTGANAFSQVNTTVDSVVYLPFISKPANWFLKDASSPQYMQNWANTAGCFWLGVAGIVLDRNGMPVPIGTYKAHVWGSGMDNRVEVGGAQVYGPSGYEQFLYHSPREQEVFIQLELNNGTAVSPEYRFVTRASCLQNLVKFDFVETK